ncbi:MAG: hypothetical protein AAF125_11565 [Chloroflexota bacterium]
MTDEYEYYPEYRDLFWDAMDRRDHDPQSAVIGMKKAIAKAREANDDRAVLEFNHWLLQTLIFKTRDIKQALPLAMQTAVEARKEKYADMEEHICVYQDLTLTCLEADPLGHGPMIEEALDYMQTEIGNQRVQCRFCFASLRSDLAFERGDHEATITETQRTIAVAEQADDHSRPYYHAYAYVTLLRVAYAREDWDRLIELSHIAIDYSEGDDDVIENLCTALMGLAVGYDATERADEADKYARRAAFEAGRTGALMDRGYYDLLRGFHARRGNHDTVLAISETELEEIEGLGQHYRAALAHLARCETLAIMGKLTAADRDAANSAIDSLKAPDALRARLDALFSGN